MEIYSKKVICLTLDEVEARALHESLCSMIFAGDLSSASEAIMDALSTLLEGKNESKN